MSLGLILKSFIHFKLTFVYDVRGPTSFFAVLSGIRIDILEPFQNLPPLLPFVVVDIFVPMSEDSYRPLGLGLEIVFL